ncbi:hypothetical protein MACH09_29270 [Vibrio sp. MACH09]|uniref:hypothetical protein n=1 Tax=Vibrio sp. MACH09 TaxID=3025122 RepID=UPI0027933ABD|nr:hypothetical protein [Vibrio sp. MACH09]GLO62419.1 hypothetical protein MACH09_29270 [Vibrio sp. MACH09]
MKQIKLLPSESELHCNDATITLATIFVGEAPINHITERLHQIVAKNPWLASRLTSSDANKLSLSVPSYDSLQSLFSVQEIADICDGSNIGSLIQEIYTPPLKPSLAKLFSKQGFKCIDNDEPLFKVNLCISDDNTFLLLLSMSHILGDGATLYRVYQMLSQAEEVISLCPDRVMEHHHFLSESGYIAGSCWLPETSTSDSAQIEALINSRAMRSTPNSRFITGFNKTLNSCDGHERALSYSGGMFRINPDKIESIKQQHLPTEKAPWLSTNDILSSWFLDLSNPSLGVIAVDARNHNDQLTAIHAGNYQVALLQNKDEYSTPASVRESVSQFPNKKPSVPVAEAVETVALVSNWASFYTQIDIGSTCQQITHFPIVPPELETPTVLDATMIIFKPNLNDLAVAIGVNGIEKYIRDGILGAPLLQ